MSLHVDSYGSGAPLLLIHGWGMHGGMWGGIAERLAEHFRVLAVDLLMVVPRGVVGGFVWRVAAIGCGAD